jgi:PBP1b-binding outer membrane lipoprotein LpoB
MKKTLVILASAILILSGCSSSEKEEVNTNAPQVEEGQPATEVAQENADDAEGTVEVDEGLLTTTLTLPSSFFNEAEPATVIENAKKQGVKEVTSNEDGSFTYTMTNKVYKKMLGDIAASVEESMTSLKSGEDFASIKDVEYDKNFSEFTLVVDKEAFQSSMDSFAALAISISAMMYQTFSGVESEALKVTIHMKDQATNEVFDTIVYPDTLEQ